MKVLNTKQAVLLIAIFLLSTFRMNAQTATIFVDSTQGLNNPQALAFDKAGNLYVANAGNKTISKVTKDGVVSVFVDSTKGLINPYSIVFDTIGNLYVANGYSSSVTRGFISKISSNGIVSTFVSSGSGLESPVAIVFDRLGNLYVANGNTNTLSKVNSNGVVSLFVSSSLIAGSVGLTIDSLGHLYVANILLRRITKVTKEGIASIVDSAFLPSPAALEFDKNGNLFVANIVEGVITKITNTGKASYFFQEPAIDGPSALAFDTFGNLYVANSAINSITKISFNTLPVAISSFVATSNNNTIQTNWQTATELNTSHFIIQHSTDGSSYKDIGIVKAIGSGANSYAFTDKHPANGINYYRLQSVDKDGSSSYSKVVSAQFTVNSNQLTVYPNPAKEAVTINGSHIASVQVIDNMGRVVKVVSLKDATNPTLSISSLAAGVYHLRIQTSDGSVSGNQLIIVK